MNYQDTYSVIDLFCGVGGLTHGFVLENFDVVAGIDFDATCRYAFEKNNAKSKFIHKDIREVTPRDILDLYPSGKKKILVGCAPCQPFSRYTSGTKSKDEEKKWELLDYFTKLIEEIKPEIVSMENVPQLAKYDKYKVYANFISTLIKNDYFISDPAKIVYCPSYGIPQSRRRLVVLASRLGAIDLIPPTHSPENFPTVRSTIGNLNPLQAGGVDEEDKLHRSQKLSPKNMQRIKSITEGQSWKNLPEELIADCHKKLTGKTFGGVYGRMQWDSPAPTMTTHCIGFGNGRFGHPDQDRAISLREAALLQTFPKTYDFFDFSNEEEILRIASIQRHIGNAVPVELGRAIARSIKKHIEYLEND